MNTFLSVLHVAFNFFDRDKLVTGMVFLRMSGMHSEAFRAKVSLVSTGGSVNLVNTLRMCLMLLGRPAAQGNITVDCISLDCKSFM